MASVTQMRQELGWLTLQNCRFTARMTMCYKAVHGLVHLPFPDYLTPKSRTMRGEHTNQYTVVQTRTDVFKYSFFPRTIRCCNIPPVTLIKKLSLDSFKTGLYTVLQEGPIYLVQPKGVYDRQQHTAAWSCVLGEKKREPSKTCI